MTTIDYRADPDATRKMEWGTLMQEIAERGLSVSIHHDDYPKWTCRLWRNVGKTRIDVEAQEWSPMEALLKAMREAQP